MPPIPYFILLIFKIATVSTQAQSDVTANCRTATGFQRHVSTSTLAPPMDPTCIAINLTLNVENILADPSYIIPQENIEVVQTALQQTLSYYGVLPTISSLPSTLPTTWTVNNECPAFVDNTANKYNFIPVHHDITVDSASMIINYGSNNQNAEIQWQFITPNTIVYDFNVQSLSSSILVNCMGYSMKAYIVDLGMQIVAESGTFSITNNMNQQVQQMSFVNIYAKLESNTVYSLYIYVFNMFQCINNQPEIYWTSMPTTASPVISMLAEPSSCRLAHSLRNTQISGASGFVFDMNALCQEELSTVPRKLFERALHQHLSKKELTLPEVPESPVNGVKRRILDEFVEQNEALPTEGEDTRRRLPKMPDPNWCLSFKARLVQLGWGGKVHIWKLAQQCNVAQFYNYNQLIYSLRTSSNKFTEKFIIKCQDGWAMWDKYDEDDMDNNPRVAQLIRLTQQLYNIKYQRCDHSGLQNYQQNYHYQNQGYQNYPQYNPYPQPQQFNPYPQQQYNPYAQQQQSIYPQYQYPQAGLRRLLSDKGLDTLVDPDTVLPNNAQCIAINPDTSRLFSVGGQNKLNGAALSAFRAYDLLGQAQPTLSEQFQLNQPRAFGMCQYYKNVFNGNKEYIMIINGVKDTRDSINTDLWYNNIIFIPADSNERLLNNIPKIKLKHAVIDPTLYVTDSNELYIFGGRDGLNAKNYIQYIDLNVVFSSTSADTLTTMDRFEPMRLNRVSPLIDMRTLKAGDIYDKCMLVFGGQDFVNDEFIDTETPNGLQMYCNQLDPISATSTIADAEFTSFDISNLQKVENFVSPSSNVRTISINKYNFVNNHFIDTEIPPNGLQMYCNQLDPTTAASTVADAEFTPFDISNLQKVDTFLSPSSNVRTISINKYNFVNDNILYKFTTSSKACFESEEQIKSAETLFKDIMFQNTLRNNMILQSQNRFKGWNNGFDTIYGIDTVLAKPLESIADTIDVNILCPGLSELSCNSKVNSLGVALCKYHVNDNLCVGR